ncbi:MULTISPECIES: hypothetical protein [Catenuloplanes]|uniref:Chaperonin cofactor prefoldin n=1 Tax=Catenuloplanes niger TaxID=587534 RepID=A0AAE3ZR15_9ACTN|nr:hypothetical protein [Catenuloplanes niger]MDR7324483.1 chaperonin cofactor prefoldin [Catenuloplanes niger]
MSPAARGGNTTVDVDSLQEFQDQLRQRLSEADHVINVLNNRLSAPLAVGTFHHAARISANYASLQSQHLANARRLRTAIVAAQTATAEILRNYTTTEELNRVSADEIASTVGDLAAPLRGTGNV